MLRFLQYSLTHGRAIRVILLLNEAMVQKNATVLALTDGMVTLRLTTRKTPVTLPCADILSCDYARGDHGEE